MNKNNPESWNGITITQANERKLFDPEERFSTGRWRNLEEPKLLKDVLREVGIRHAIYALQIVEGFERQKRLFACECARFVLPFCEKLGLDDNSPQNTIKTAERYAYGDASDDDLADAYRFADICWDEIGKRAEQTPDLQVQNASNAAEAAMWTAWHNPGEAACRAAWAAS